MVDITFMVDFYYTVFMVSVTVISQLLNEAE